MLFAAPTIASRAKAIPKSGRTAISEIGSPQQTSESENQPASRRWSSVIARSAPRSPPKPMAAVR
jgi:hypothetical protein